MINKLNSNYWMSLAIVMAGTFITYFFSLFHMLRSEILVYFFHAGNNNSIPSLIYNTMNRTTGASDTWLFRPLGSVILAVGKVALDFNAIAWHILALVLFMIAVWCMFRLLWKIRLGIIAMLMALLFGTFYASVNAVLYTQLISYLVFIALTLAGLFYLYRGVEVGKKRDIYVALALMFVSCFLYEIGVVLIILSGVYVWLKRKDTKVNLKHSIIATASIFVAFMVVYGAVKFISPTEYQIAELSRTFSPDALLKGFSYVLYLPAYWMPMIIMPSAYKIFPIANLEMQTAGISSVFPIVWMLINIVAILTIGIFALPRKGEKRNNAFPLILGITAFVFVCLVGMYRGNDVHTGIMYVISTNITLNMFLAWVIPLAFWYIRPKKEHFKYVAVAILFIVCLSASKTFMLNYQTWVDEKPFREYEAYVDKFVEQNKDLPDFTFSTKYNSPMYNGYRDILEENLNFYWPDVQPDGAVNLVEANYFQVKYYQYWDAENPQWIVEYNSNSGEFTAGRNLGLLK